MSNKGQKGNGATAARSKEGRRFITAFLISLGSMAVAALVYVLVGERFVFDWKTQALIAVLVLIGAIIGVWLIKREEKHTGYGVLFGTFFGLLLGAIAVVLIALLLTAFPALGIF